MKQKLPHFYALERETPSSFTFVASASSIKQLESAVLKDTQASIEDILAGEDKSLLYDTEQPWSEPVYLLQLVRIVVPEPVITAKAKLRDV